MRYDLKITLTCDLAKVIYAISAFIYALHHVGVI